MDLALSSFEAFARLGWGQGWGSGGAPSPVAVDVLVRHACVVNHFRFDDQLSRGAVLGSSVRGS